MLAGLGMATVAGQGPSTEADRAILSAGHPAIRYARGESDDAFARLIRRVETGSTGLPHDARLGYLPALLESLDVPADSQSLVFSKTSLLSEHIGPRRPRAIYFTEEVAIGFVPDAAMLEVMAFVPGDGVHLYTVERATDGTPRFSRPNICLQCHQAATTLGVPGPYVGSVSTTVSGRPDFRLGTIVTDHRTPFEDRWGGWYVTGSHGAQRHRGNAVSTDRSFLPGRVVPPTQNLTSLDGLVDLDAYPVPTSDIVALMTLEHQAHLLNLFTRADWEARIAAHDGVVDDEEARARARLVEEIVRYMLFADEAPLAAPVRGTSTFAETFEARGARDRRGRSLRELDLTTRLFRYRLSYLIYTPLFDQLASSVREAISRRLLDVLEGRAEHDYPHPPAERRAILEILRETRPGLTGGLGWTAGGGLASVHVSSGGDEHHGPASGGTARP